MEPTPAPEPRAEFRWQAFFQRSRDPLFLLNRQRRILFVNRAWEELTRLDLAVVRGLACTRRKPVVPTATSPVTRALCPPAEALQGRSVSIRRSVLGNRWDIDYLPFNDKDGLLCILGRVTATAVSAPAAEPLPENLEALRSARGRRHPLERIESGVPAVVRAAAQARLAAPTRAAVLIVGEVGTGKHWWARAIHELGLPQDRPFAAIDCRRLPAWAIEQALFGDAGLIGSGSAGTVYLREPGSLSRDLQARLTEVLAESPPTRIIAGSVSDLTAEVRSLRVLEEFRCRLSTLVIELPSLRDRLADLPAFVEAFLERTGGPSVEISAEAWDLFRSYSWPGNLSELFMVLVRVRERATAGRVGPAELPAVLRRRVGLEVTPRPGKDDSLPLATLLEEAERRLIQMALQRAGGNKTRAAELLGLWKPRLLRRMAALGLLGS